MEPGLAIRMPDKRSTVARIKRTGYLPLHARPKHLRMKGGLVAMVQSNDTVVLVGRTAGLEEQKPVTLVDGQRRIGYKLRLIKMRRARPRKTLRIQWHKIGQFRYFDTKRWVPILVGPPDPVRRGSYLEAAANDTGALAIRRGSFTGTVPGKPRSHPESQLVRRFVDWLRCESDMEQHRLLPDRFQTDLFDGSKWRLIEAKVLSDRTSLRNALGQLYDYRRFYARGPSLGILVGSRPQRKGIAYLHDHRITAIWETRGGQFRDSAGGLWTRLRQRIS